MNFAPTIRFEPSDQDPAAWQAAASEFLDHSLMQDWAFGDAKAETGPWRAERGLFTQNGRVVGAVQAMIREVPWIGGGLVWINRGPLWRTHTGESPDRLGALLGALRARWARDGYYLRIAPPLAGPFSASGFVAAGTAGWASARVDLTVTQDELRAGLHQKWRNALNKAERSGLQVSSGVEFFPEFRDGFARFLSERQFPTSLTPEFLDRLQNALPPERRMVTHVARVGGSPVGGALIARYDDTAEYLAGFATEAGHGHNVGQTLLWRALIAAKDANVRWFDVGGMDETRTPEGIYHFKVGLGGVPYRLAGEIENCPADPRAWLVRWRVRAATGGDLS